MLQWALDSLGDLGGGGGGCLELRQFFKKFSASVSLTFWKLGGWKGAQGLSAEQHKTQTSLIL